MFEMKTKKVNTDELKFGESGLVCVIAQDYESGEVLLQSYMNRECVDKTFASGYVYYYDPASGLPRKKGEASGNTQKVVTAFLDDDKDCLLLKVRQKGFACHTGTYTCFAEQIKGEDNEIGGEMFGKLQRIVEERKKEPRRRVLYKLFVCPRHRQDRQEGGGGGGGACHRVQKRRQFQSGRGSGGFPLSYDGASGGKGREAVRGVLGAL